MTTCFSMETAQVVTVTWALVWESRHRCRLLHRNEGVLSLSVVKSIGDDTQSVQIQPVSENAVDPYILGACFVLAKSCKGLTKRYPIYLAAVTVHKAGSE